MNIPINKNSLRTICYKNNILYCSTRVCGPCIRLLCRQMALTLGRLPQAVLKIRNELSTWTEHAWQFLLRKFLDVLFSDFVVDKIAELLSKTKEPELDASSPKASSSSPPSFEMVEPLMRVFREDVDLTSEAQKEIAWEKHFGVFGRGVTMFRTVETTEKILEGIPDKQVLFRSFRL